MVVALLSAVVLVVLVWVAHVVTDVLNARRDYQFYNEVTRFREDRRADAEAEIASEREIERKRVG